MPRLKKGSKEAKAFMAKIRSKKKVSGVANKSNRQTGTTTKRIDKKIQAKPPGKRIVKKGKKKSTVYYERRANHSDKGVLLGIGAIKKDLSLKHRTIVACIAAEKGSIARCKELSKNEPSRLPNKKKILRESIKKSEKIIQEYQAMKRNLSKFK